VAKKPSNLSLENNNTMKAIVVLSLFVKEFDVSLQFAYGNYCGNECKPLLCSVNKA
jgi:hypothetical protein